MVCKESLLGYTLSFRELKRLLLWFARNRCSDILSTTNIPLEIGLWFARNRCSDILFARWNIWGEELWFARNRCSDILMKEGKRIVCALWFARNRCSDILPFQQPLHSKRLAIYFAKKNRADAGHFHSDSAIFQHNFPFFQTDGPLE